MSWFLTIVMACWSKPRGLNALQMRTVRPSTLFAHGRRANECAGLHGKGNKWTRIEKTIPVHDRRHEHRAAVSPHRLTFQLLHLQGSKPAQMPSCPHRRCWYQLGHLSVWKKMKVKDWDLVVLYRLTCEVDEVYSFSKWYGSVSFR